MHGRGEVCPAKRRSLGIRDGHQRHLWKPEIELEGIGKIQSAVKRCQNAGRLRAEQRKVQIVYVKVQDIKIICTLTHLVEHQHELWNGITGSVIKTQSAGRTSNKLGGSDCVCAREQGHFVP